MRRIVADYPLVITALLLSMFGVAMVYSAGQTDTPTAVAHVYRSQLLWLVFGVVGAYAISRSSVRFIEWVTLPAYILSTLLLAATLVVGKGAGTAASSKSWLAIGGVRIGQPSEVAKLTVILMLALILAKRKEPPRS
ncbi:MAG: FtsW/RodA/SpoVE family cell cycle protein, partial [Gemmatimonadaceae bacterium]